MITGSSLHYLIVFHKNAKLLSFFFLVLSKKFTALSQAEPVSIVSAKVEPSPNREKSLQEIV